MESLEVSDLYFEICKNEVIQPATSFFRSIELTCILKYVKPVGKLLDIGCGNGQICNVLSRRWGNINQYIGIDTNKSQCESAKQLGLYSKVHNTTVYDIPEPASSFDSIFSNSVIEHIPDTKKVLSEISRTLKNKGKFYLTVPNYNWNLLLKGATFPVNLYMPTERDDYLNLFNQRVAIANLYDYETWKNMLDEVGLELEYAYPYLNQQQFQAWEYIANLTGGLIWKISGEQQNMEDLQNNSGYLKKLDSIKSIFNRTAYFFLRRFMYLDNPTNGTCFLLIGNKR
jgi:SAM-dependent methyltransferase